MKHVFYFLALSTLLIFSVGCGNDDDGPSCTQDQFLGTFTGTDECEGLGNPSGTFTITAGTSANTLTITDDLGIANEATIDGCGFSWGGFTLGTGSKGTGSVDGDMLTLIRETKSLNATVLKCTFDGTK